MLTNDDINALAQVTDTTWGQSSTDAMPTMSVKMSLTTDDTAVVKYTTVITFQGNLTQSVVHREHEVAQKVIDAYLKEVKKGFKELTGHAVKLKLVDLEPSVELIDINTFSPLRTVRTAYFRCLGEVEVG
jgi:hypothetical protein